MTAVTVSDRKGRRKRPLQGKGREHRAPPQPHVSPSPATHRSASPRPLCTCSIWETWQEGDKDLISELISLPRTNYHPRGIGATSRAGGREARPGVDASPADTPESHEQQGSGKG